jgi:signal transduction histidine kinase
VLDRLRPRSLRGRLAAAILLVAVAVLAGSFIALHERTGDDIRAGIDDRLRADLVEFGASPAGSSTSEEELLRRARRFIASQGYHSDSRIFAIQAGGRTITNQPALVSSEEAGESGTDDHAAAATNGLLTAPDGLASVDLPDDGLLRVLSEPVSSAGTQIGTFHVAESLRQVGFAQGSLRDTLVVVGVIALGILLAAALWIAGLVARPLSRMADFARGIDTEGLDRRLPVSEGTSEVRSLADSFNRMLDRLQGAFEREREFVADASHELRTPVTIAQGELELLRREAAPAERERIDAVRRELKRMGRLIEEMLSLAAADSEGAMRKEPIPLDDLLSDVRRDLPLLGPRNYEVAELGGTVLADPDRLAQVFRNLAQNAVAHTDPDGHVEVAATPRDGRVRFEVRDDGTGIRPEEAEHLFNRFYRADGTRRRDQGGSGLGLAIAQAIVVSHGGRIWAEGAPGHGTTITFELPGYQP